MSPEGQFLMSLDTVRRRQLDRSRECLQKNEAIQPASTELTGFVRVRAASLEEAKRFLVGNPVYEAGGTVEIRELPRE